MSSLFDANGQPIRKVSDEQLIMAMNTISRRNQSQQIQLMQLGILVEFLIEKLGKVTLADGNPVFSVEEKEFEDFSRKRYEEIKVEAAEFNRLIQERENGGSPAVNLQE